MMFAKAEQLREAGVLGLNERNTDFIMRLNPRRLYPRVDDKALTKQLAFDAGMAVPELYGIISNQGETRERRAVAATVLSWLLAVVSASGTHFVWRAACWYLGQKSNITFRTSLVASTA